MSSTESGRPSRSQSSAAAREMEVLSTVGIFLFSFKLWMRSNLPDDRGMTVPRAAMLLALANKKGRIGMSALGDMNGLSPRNMTVLVDGLEKEGLVERVPHPSDRRITLIGITESGSRLVKSALGPSQAKAAALFDDLSATEQKELVRLLTKLLGALRKRGIDVPGSDPS